jgi:hypothetical protein
VSDVEFGLRPGGRTLSISQLNAVFVDEHTSWYSVHWNTHLNPADFISFCLERLGLHSDAPAVMQLNNSVSTGHLGEVPNKISAPEKNSVRFLRFDTRDCVLVWEPSATYEKLRREREIPYTAIVGFGSDKFDEKFIWEMLQSGTAEIISASWEIANGLSFLGDSFRREHIDPARSYEYD